MEAWPHSAVSGSFRRCLRRSFCLQSAVDVARKVSCVLNAYQSGLGKPTGWCMTLPNPSFSDCWKLEIEIEYTVSVFTPQKLANRTFFLSFFAKLVYQHTLTGVAYSHILTESFRKHRCWLPKREVLCSGPGRYPLSQTRPCLHRT